MLISFVLWQFALCITVPCFLFVPLWYTLQFITFYCLVLFYFTLLLLKSLSYFHCSKSNIALTWFLGDLSVPFRHGERIGFSYLVSQKYTGENAVVKVLRNGKILEFKIKLANYKKLIPAHIKGKPPSYYIIAGFVFTAISVPYLRSEVGS